MNDIENLCRVCLRQNLDDDDRQVTYLNTQRIEKLIYIGDSSEIVRLNNEPIPLCIKCDIKLDLVYDYVVMFNNAKEKLRQLCSLYDPYQVVDLNLDSIDTDQDEAREVFHEIIKVEPPPTPEQSLNCTLGSNPKPKIGPKSKRTKHSKPAPKKTIQCDDQQYDIRQCDDEDYDVQQYDDQQTDVQQYHVQHYDHTTLEGTSSSDGSSVCYICQKTFSTRANMLRHVREHLGRRFICEYDGCKSFFTQKSSLQVHIARHKGLKPYECELCGKKFSQSKSLVFHRRVHTGESPYECDYCEKKFKQKSNLIRHFKCHRKPTKPTQRRFKCPKCSKYLASKQSLIRHLMRHERMDFTPIKIEMNCEEN